jgi:predicted TPR repeat methyltransferase
MKLQTTDDVFDLMNAYTTSAALNAALRLGLFWRLDQGPMNAELIANYLAIPINRCTYWLQILDATGMIEPGPSGYQLTRTAKSAIIDAYSQATWSFLAIEACERFPAVHDPMQIQNQGSIWEILGREPPDYVAQMQKDSDRARRFTRMLYELHKNLAEQVAGCLDMRAVDRMMDLGGGSGVLSMALIRRNPGLTSVIVDIPNVCAAGREIVEENDLQDRVTYLEADFLRDELPSGFDMVLNCDAGPYTKDLMCKIHSSLKPGGRLVIIDQFASADGFAPRAWLHWAYLASMENPKYSMLSLKEVISRLIQAGYHILSERMLPNGDGLRWDREWNLIDAAK